MQLITLKCTHWINVFGIQGFLLCGVFFTFYLLEYIIDVNTILELCRMKNREKWFLQKIGWIAMSGN